jgi:DNA-binding CsgD family transcriptional regulator
MTSTTARPTTATSSDSHGPGHRGGALGRAVRQLGIDSAYSLLGLPVAVASFTILVTGLATGGGLLITLIGLPVLTGTLLAARAFADLHRITLRGVTRRDSPRPRYRRAAGERGRLGKIVAPMRDPQSWLDLTAGVLDLPLAILAFTVAVTWWSLAIGGLTSALWEWAVPHGDNSSVATALRRLERDVLALMAEGRSNAAIAKELVVTDGAVEKHVKNIFMKLDLPPDDEQHRRVLAVLTYLRG